MSVVTSNNIGCMLRNLAKESPDIEAICSKDISLSRGKLFRIIESYAIHMQRNGIGKDSLVSVDTSDAIVSISSVFALSLLGARYIPFEPELPNRSSPKVTHFLNTAERIPSSKVANILIDHTWSPKYTKESLEIADPNYFSSADDIAWIVPSSGTTGRPKYSSLTREVLRRRVVAIAEDYEGQATRLLMLFDCSTRPYIIRAVSTLLAGHTIVDSLDPGFVAAAGVNFVCASPQQARMWLKDQAISPKLPVLQVSGAKMPEADIVKLLRSFERVEDVYGSNETIKAHVNVHTQEQDGVVCEGKAGPVCVEVIDDSGRPCHEGSKGNLRVRTDYMVDSYIDEPELTAKHFKFGYFYPGDTGRWLSGNVLEVLGRSSDIVNIGGQKVALSDIEARIAQNPSVIAAGCFENPVPSANLELAACIVLEARQNTRETIKQIWKDCAIQFGAMATPGSMLVVPRLSLTHDGVVRRADAKKVFIETLSKCDPVELKSHLFTFG